MVLLVITGYRCEYRTNVKHLMNCAQQIAVGKAHPADKVDISMEDRNKNNLRWRDADDSRLACENTYRHLKRTRRNSVTVGMMESIVTLLHCCQTSAIRMHCDPSSYRYAYKLMSFGTDYKLLPSFQIHR